MTTLLVAGFLGALILFTLAIQQRSALRTVGRVLLGGFFLLMLVVTAVLVYGAAALNSRGGGVLILVAFVPGFFAWITGSMFFAAAKHEAYYDLTVSEKIHANLASLAGTSEGVQERVARLEAERGRIWTTPARRAAIDRALAHERRLSGALPALRPALEDPRTYDGDEP